MNKSLLLNFIKRRNKNTMPKLVSGFTLIEVLIVLAIITMLVSMSISSFSVVGGNEALETSIVSTISILNEARSMAISSKDASGYGVRIFNDRLVSFKNSYGTLNREFILPNLVSISTSTGIGNDIIFSNVSGITSASGTITVINLSDTSKTGSVKIYQTGIIERE